MNQENQEELAGYRQQIDEIDHDIIKLLAQRTAIVKKLMVLKTDEESVKSCDRVQQVLDKVSHIAEANGLEPHIVVPVYQTLIKVLTEMQLEHLRSRQGIAGVAND
ncbi:chorismate mutase [Paenibacillus sp. GCM10027627]|uniref:chorismate mutase n=1 Tax=unclassified Paenibacillus TaxID=185978 RepID=UPI0036310B93